MISRRSRCVTLVTTPGISQEIRVLKSAIEFANCRSLVTVLGARSLVHPPSPATGRFHARPTSPAARGNHVLGPFIPPRAPPSCRAEGLAPRRPGARTARSARSERHPPHGPLRAPRPTLLARPGFWLGVSRPRRPAPRPGQGRAAISSRPARSQLGAVRAAQRRLAPDRGPGRPARAATGAYRRPTPPGGPRRVPPGPRAAAPGHADAAAPRGASGPPGGGSARTGPRHAGRPAPGGRPLTAPASAPSGPRHTGPSRRITHRQLTTSPDAPTGIRRTIRHRGAGARRPPGPSVAPGTPYQVTTRTLANCHRLPGRLRPAVPGAATAVFGRPTAPLATTFASTRAPPRVGPSPPRAWPPRTGTPPVRDGSGAGRRGRSYRGSTRRYAARHPARGDGGATSLLSHRPLASHLSWT